MRWMRRCFSALVAGSVARCAALFDPREAFRDPVADYFMVCELLLIQFAPKSCDSQTFGMTSLFMMWEP
jgi:hypothetical protein